MAQCFGQSGCWKKIVSQLKELGVSIDSLEQIFQIIHEIEIKLHAEQTNAESEYNKNLLFFKEILEKTQLSSQQEIATQTFETNKQLIFLNQHIQQNQLSIAQITEEQEQQIFLLCSPLVNQLNDLNNQINYFDNKINELEVIFKQKKTSLYQVKKPAWYKLFAKIKHYFWVNKQITILNKEYQLAAQPHQTQLVALTKARNNLLTEKYKLQTQHEKQLQTLLSPLHEENNLNFLKKQNLTKELEHKIKMLHLNVEKHQKDLTDFEQRKILFIQDKVRETFYKLERLNVIRESPDYKGAIAELEMIDFLKKLPNNHFVFSDVTLHSSGYHQHQGKPLISAQIDHLVICSKGVFVIEVKYWSKKFIQHDNYFSPYEQVERASKLCWILLKDDFETIKTKSIIAYKEAIPQKDSASYVKALKIPYVNQYITGDYFQTVFTDAQLHKLVNYFKNKVNHNGTETESYFKTKGRFY